MRKRKVRAAQMRRANFLRKEISYRPRKSELLSLVIQGKSSSHFLEALKKVVEAQGGIGMLSRVTKLNRQSMYRMFSERGNPTLASLFAVLHALGARVLILSRERNG